jgi:hypothetical protein
MAPSWDDQLRSGEPEEPTPAQPPVLRRTSTKAAVAVLVVAAAVAAYIAFRGAPQSDPSAVDTAPPTAATAPTQPLGGDASAVALPPLEETDPIVRKLVGELSSHPRILAWLATDGLLRTFTAAVVATAEGKTPASLVPVLRPSGAFEVREAGEDLDIDPRSYQRYNALADAVASLDAAGTARLYTMLKPRLEDAYRELGLPDASFDRPLEQAIVLLLRTPRVSGAIHVQPHGIGYRFSDAALEDLSPAQKQLLRMGPRNVEVIQSKLRAIALELGIAPARLPPTP